MRPLRQTQEDLGKEQQFSGLLFAARDFHFFQSTLWPTESQLCYLMGNMPGAIVHRPTAWSRKGKSPQTSDYQRKQMETPGGGITVPGYFQFCFYLHFKKSTAHQQLRTSEVRSCTGQDDVEWTTRLDGHIMTSNDQE